MTILDRRDIPTAASVSIFSCGDPTCFPHLVLEDETGRPFAEAVIPREAIFRLLAKILYKDKIAIEDVAIVLAELQKGYNPL